MKVILILPPLRATKIFFRFQATKKCIVGNILSLQQLFITLCPKRELISFQGQILGCRHSFNIIWMRSSSSVFSLLHQLFYQILSFLNFFILPLFDYGDIIWGDRGNVSLMSDLQVLQNKAARLILIFLRIVLHPRHWRDLHWVEVFITA